MNRRAFLQLRDEGFTRSRRDGQPQYTTSRLLIARKTNHTSATDKISTFRVSLPGLRVGPHIGKEVQAICLVTGKTSPHTQSVPIHSLTVRTQSDKSEITDQDRRWGRGYNDISLHTRLRTRGSHLAMPCLWPRFKYLSA